MIAPAHRRLPDAPAADPPQRVELTLNLNVPQAVTDVLMQLLSRATMPDFQPVETTSPTFTPSPPPPPPRQTPAPPSPEPDPVPPPRRRGRSLWKVWKQKDVQEHLSAESKMDGHKTAVKWFCLWYRAQARQNDLWNTFPEVAFLDADRNLLKKYFLWQLERVEVSTAETYLSGMTCFWRALHDLGYCKLPCPELRKKRILKQSGKKKKHYIPIGIALPDAKRWIDGVGQEPVTWLRNFYRRREWGISPRRFVQLVLGSSLFYGWNIGDVFAIKSHHVSLTWDDIHFGPVPPFRGAETIRGIEWHRGWMHISRNKTGVEAWVPICHYMAELLATFRGCDDRVVFPPPYSNCESAWYRTLRNSKKKAGLYHTQAALKAAEAKNIVDVYDVSMSDRAPSRSCRKRCAILWKQFGNRSQASHMLAHSTQSAGDMREDLAAANEVASEMTERHYGGSEIYPDIVRTAPKVESEIESHLQLLGE